MINHRRLGPLVSCVWDHRVFEDGVFLAEYMMLGRERESERQSTGTYLTTSTIILSNTKTPNKGLESLSSTLGGTRHRCFSIQLPRFLPRYNFFSLSKSIDETFSWVLS